MTNTAAKISDSLTQGNLFNQTNKKNQEKIAALPRMNPLKKDLEDLARLIANISESHTASIYLADRSKRTLKLGSVHTLSRDFDHYSEIPYGNGLIGWTAENELRISVSPFEHDASTLLCYKREQNLKSFIAIPVHCPEKNLLAVIACDSKKSYAFSKVTEKLLFDCARQASNIIALHHGKKIETKTPKEEVKKTDLSQSLLNFNNENKLLSAAASIPKSEISRDALLIICNSDAGIGQEIYYSANSENRASQELLELVCQNKKLLSGADSISQLPELVERSFLSVPFEVLGKNAGSINLLSSQDSSFSVQDISNTEKVASLVGRELERIRLKEKFNETWENSSTDSWRHFEIRAKHWIKESIENNTPLSLVRFTLTNLNRFETAVGPKGTTLIIRKLMRLVDQVKRTPSLTSFLYGNQILLLCDNQDLENTLSRLEKLVQRITAEELGIKNSTQNIAELIEDNIDIKCSSLCSKTTDFDSLMSKTL